MKRFLFGLFIGVLMTLFFQARGEQILRAVGIDPERLSERVGALEKKLLGAMETTEDAGEAAKRIGEKAQEKLAP